MRQTIASRLQLGIAHGFAGGCHDEGGLQGAEMCMLAGVHLVSSFLMRPEEEFRAPALANQSCVGCAGSTVLPSPARRCDRSVRGLSARPAGCAAVRGRG